MNEVRARIMAAATAAALTALTVALPRKAGADAPPTTTLIAFVAANAQAPFDQVVGAFERANATTLVNTEYAGTQILETQAEQGAPFDVFVSADRAHIDKLHAEGLVSAPVLLSLGHEVIVVPAGNPAGIESLRDLADKPAKLVLGDDSVPIGIYTRQVLQNASRDYGADFPARVLAHAVSLETNVKQVLAKVALGEADAGVVYFTDVTPSFADKVQIIPIPQAYEVEAGNYIAVASQSKDPDIAKALMAYATGTDGRQIFRRNGYDPMP